MICEYELPGVLAARTWPWPAAKYLRSVPSEETFPITVYCMGFDALELRVSCPEQLAHYPQLSGPVPGVPGEH